jgi:hypothetical protein
MKALKRLRPSPAMAIACVALFAALGGGAYAAATINGNSIKKGTITPSKIKSRSLSGSQVRSNGIGGPSIKESTLGEVPKAKAAQTATNATNATNATTAKNATELGGVAASGYQRYGAIAAGQTVSGAFGCYQEDADNVTGCTAVQQFPSPAPAALSNATVNFAASVGSFVAGDADATCTGNVDSPTAPPGKVCLYFANLTSGGVNVNGLGNIIANTNGTRGFEVALTAGAATKSINLEGVWAYTAP